jgi:hypothetical protein
MLNKMLLFALMTCHVSTFRRRLQAQKSRFAEERSQRRRFAAAVRRLEISKKPLIRARHGD